MQFYGACVGTCEQPLQPDARVFALHGIDRRHRLTT